MATITWRGREVHDKLAEAAGVGVDATMAACVHDARADHAAFPPASEPGEPYANRTTFATETIRMDTPAAPTLDDRVVGAWGGYANYFLFLEIGTSIAGPTAAERESEGGGNLDAVPAPIGPLMGARPTLRPAADRQNPLLAERIAAAWRGDVLP